MRTRLTTAVVACLTAAAAATGAGPALSSREPTLAAARPAERTPHDAGRGRWEQAVRPGRAAADSTAVDPIARYRLTAPALSRFEAASREIAAATREDARYLTAPLFSREVAMLGDVRAAANGLEARLQNDPALVRALGASKMTAREYATFAIALIAARLADGFVTAGVLRNVPPGVTADNVAFVASRRGAISAVLTDLGVSGMPGDTP